MPIFAIVLLHSSHGKWEFKVRSRERGKVSNEKRRRWRDGGTRSEVKDELKTRGKTLKIERGGEGRKKGRGKK